MSGAKPSSLPLRPAFVTDTAFITSVLSASPDCVTVLADDGTILFMNDTGVALNELGSAVETLGGDYVATWPAEEQAKVRAALDGARGGRTMRIEGFCPTAKGTPRWWETNVAPFRMGDDAPLHIVGISRDVTERRRAERALRDTERELRHTLKAGGFGTWTLVIETGELSTSQAFRLNHGRNPDVPFSDAEFRAAIHPDDRSRLAEAMGASIATGVDFDIEYRIATPAGEERWISVRGQVIAGEDGRPNRVRGIAQDVSSAKRMERHLRQLNETLEQSVEERTRERDQLWELSEDLLIASDFSGRLLKVSPSWAKLLGRSAKDLLDGGYADIIHPEDLIDVIAGIRGMRETGRPLALEHRLMAADGSWRWVAWTLSPEPGGDRFTGIGRNVTEQRERQVALNAAEEALRQSQKMEAVGQLTGGVAHDFNNLLTVLRSSVDLLKRPNLTEERRQRYIEAISDTTTRAAKLTGQLLAFARRQALKPEVFDVAESVRAIGDMVVTLTGSRVTIETHIPDRPCFVNADASQFDTCLVNLAVNARDAMNGEGTLSIVVEAATHIPPLRAHGPKTGTFVAISMTDTGTGIAAIDIERIFEPFFTTKGVGQGTGLGLSQVFGFVKQSGGEVAVDSVPGQGTTFTLYLPRVAGEAQAAASVEAQPAVDGQGTCVLVVEDNAAVGTFATQTLEELGYRSVLAVDAATALAELAKGADRFDVVFSDVVMPGMSGVDLAGEIRARHPDLPVVLVSGFSHVLAQNGAHGFELLHKPYSIEQLSRVLTKAAHRRRLQRLLEA